MAYELIIFPDPLTAQGILELGSGLKLNSHSVIHQPSGRPAIGFAIPTGSANGHGARLTLFAAGRVTITQKAILWLRTNDDYYPWVGPQTAAFAIDDFTLPLVPSTPVDPPIGDKSPEEIIQAVYNTGLYNITTHDGCGQFTEACCTALHEQHSSSWGHIRKNPGQEQYNRHAIDAIMLLNAMPDCDRGIYDIIIQSQAPDAHPGFFFVSGPNATLWYYPA